jgi:maltose O-acetyltransferase
MLLRNRVISIRQFLALFVYYVFLRYAPESNSIFFGKFFKTLRYICCKNIFYKCGKNVNIERGAFFASGVALEIGDNSGLGINCNVPSNTVIGKNVMMGPNCYIFGSNHKFSETNIPIIEQGFDAPKQTIINDDVWIGRNVIFTPGRCVRSGTIIGAGCVLSRDFPSFSVVVGNPSVAIRNRMHEV